jgi:endonuclease YncB( thermonuclease family)
MAPLTLRWGDLVRHIATISVVALLAVAATAITPHAARSVQQRSVGELVSGEAAVVDGATFNIGSERYRLWGVDAPDAGDWCYRSDRRWRPGREAAAALRTCIGGKVVTCRVQRLESRFFAVRFVSECWTSDGQDLGACMVRGGWATDYTCYSSGFYREAEAEARSKRAGLWQCDNGAPTRRWGKRGFEQPCEKDIYKPMGPGR